MTVALNNSSHSCLKGWHRLESEQMSAISRVVLAFRRGADANVKRGFGCIHHEANRLYDALQGTGLSVG
jgi:hypothetical protein